MVAGVAAAIDFISGDLNKSAEALVQDGVRLVKPGIALLAGDCKTDPFGGLVGDVFDAEADGGKCKLFIGEGGRLAADCNRGFLDGEVGGSSPEEPRPIGFLTEPNRDTGPALLAGDFIDSLNGDGGGRLAGEPNVVAPISTSGNTSSGDSTSLARGDIFSLSFLG